MIIQEILSNRNSRGPSAGFGLMIPFAREIVDKKKTRMVGADTMVFYKDVIYNLAVDYSFEWHWFLNPIHRVSVAVSFADKPE